MEFGLFEVIGHSLFWFIIGYVRVISLLPPPAMKEVLAGGLIESQGLEDVKRFSGKPNNEEASIWIFKVLERIMLIPYFTITIALLII
jgi:hypothetical protein